MSAVSAVSLGRGYNSGYWQNGAYIEGTRTFGYGYYDRIEPLRRFGSNAYPYRQYDSAVLPNYYHQLAPRMGMVPTGTRGHDYVRYGYNMYSTKKYGVIGAFNLPY